MGDIPKMVVFFVATYLLGQTSKVYFRAMTRRFCVFDEASGAAARLLGYTLDYERLKDIKKGAISKETVAKHLVTATKMEAGQYEPDEILAFVNFCYQAMLKDKETTFKDDIKNLLSLNT